MDYSDDTWHAHMTPDRKSITKYCGKFQHKRHSNVIRLQVLDPTMSHLRGLFCRCRTYSTISRAASKLKFTTEHLTGHSDVLEAQNLVAQKKNELRQWRSDLAIATSSLEELQQKLKNLYVKKTQLYQEQWGQRKDLSALQAIHDEEETLLFKEQELHTNVENCRQQERQCFENLSDAIQESHEKERAQSERMKYYSRLGSVLGALFGFLGSNLFLRREIRQHNLKQQAEMESVKVTVQSAISPDTIHDRNEEFMTKFQERLKHLQALHENEVTSVLENLRQSCQLLETGTAEMKKQVEVLQAMPPGPQTVSADQQNGDLFSRIYISLGVLIVLLLIARAE